uniref:Uncharacterized protein n=1 Tax=Anguilla anguilla TaxID=7936 RepID=A0A0E9QHC7_ANGAN
MHRDLLPNAMLRYLSYTGGSPALRQLYSLSLRTQGTLLCFSETLRKKV